MGPSLEARIRDRAYQMWNMGGREDGQAERNWLAAEQEVLAEVSPSASPRLSGPAQPAKTIAKGKRRR